MRNAILVTVSAAVLSACSVRDTTENEAATATGQNAADLTPEAAGIFDKLLNNGKPMKLGLQKLHPNQTMMTLNALQVKPTETVVNFTVVNGSTRTITLANLQESTFIVAGNRQFNLVPPLDNKQLKVASGQTMTGDLVFIGAVPQSDAISVVFNSKYGGEAEYSSDPVFKFDISNAAAAFSNDGSKKKSA